jgi:hypothetical protein
LTYSNDCNVSSGMHFGATPGNAGQELDAGGRGDDIRIGGNVYSYYVSMAGTSGGGGGSPLMGVAVWDTRTGQFVGGTYATDGDPTTQACDRAMVAVDEFDRFCVAWAYKPISTSFGYQTVARVGKFDGSQFTWLTHSFYPFLNHDQDPNTVQGYTTVNPYVAMTASKICMAAKGSINSANNVALGPDSAAQTTVYTVITHPVPIVTVQPTVSIGRPDATDISISWDASAGNTLWFMQHTTAPVTGS